MRTEGANPSDAELSGCDFLFRRELLDGVDDLLVSLTNKRSVSHLSEENRKDILG